MVPLVLIVNLSKHKYFNINFLFYNIYLYIFSVFIELCLNSLGFNLNIDDSKMNSNPTTILEFLFV